MVAADMPVDARKCMYQRSPPKLRRKDPETEAQPGRPLVTALRRAAGSPAAATMPRRWRGSGRGGRDWRTPLVCGCCLIRAAGFRSMSRLNVASIFQEVCASTQRLAISIDASCAQMSQLQRSCYLAACTLARTVQQAMNSHNSSKAAINKILLFGLGCRRHACL